MTQHLRNSVTPRVGNYVTRSARKLRNFMTAHRPACSMRFLWIVTGPGGVNKTRPVAALGCPPVLW